MCDVCSDVRPSDVTSALAEPGGDYHAENLPARRRTLPVVNSVAMTTLPRLSCRPISVSRSPSITLSLPLTPVSRLSRNCNCEIFYVNTYTNVYKIFKPRYSIIKVVGEP